MAVDGGLTIVDALKSVVQWNVFADAWVHSAALTTDGVFKAFFIPFSDLKSQFDNSSHLESVVFFGLDNNYKTDLILFGINANNKSKTTMMKAAAGGTPVENNATPVPPFGGDDFGLM